MLVGDCLHPANCICLAAHVCTWLTGLGAFPDPVRIANLTAEYSSPNVFTTLAIFLLFSLTVDMVGPLILALGEEIGWRGRSPSGFIIPWLIRMRVMKSDQLL
jgi:hypothetical protein